MEPIGRSSLPTSKRLGFSRREACQSAEFYFFSSFFWTSLNWMDSLIYHFIFIFASNLLNISLTASLCINIFMSGFNFQGAKHVNRRNFDAFQLPPIRNQLFNIYLLCQRTTPIRNRFGMEGRYIYRNFAQNIPKERLRKDLYEHFNGVTPKVMTSWILLELHCL